MPTTIEPTPRSKPHDWIGDVSPLHDRRWVAWLGGLAGVEVAAAENGARVGVARRLEDFGRRRFSSRSFHR
jgi:hypothetical protein